MNKAIFWDFDGTLILPVSRWSAALFEALNSLNYKIPMEVIKYHLKTGFTWHTPEKEYTKSTGAAWWTKLFEYFDLFYDKYSVKPNDKLFINKYIIKYLLDEKHYSLYDDTISTLEKCANKGYKSYILSNNFPELTTVIKKLDINKYFSHCIISANIGFEKPRNEIFKYALQIAGMPDKAIMVGDNAIADIQGGKMAGMETIIVHNDTILADYVCAQLRDMPALLS